MIAGVLVAAGSTVMAGAAGGFGRRPVLSPQQVQAVAADARPIGPRPTSPRCRPVMPSASTRRARQAVERRRAVGRRTARENVADLVDDGSFVEYGPLVIAAQRRRRSLEELIERTPADGMIGGIGTVNGDLFDGHAAQVVAVSYDYTVLAGTQGLQNHRKKDRLFDLAESMRLPVVFFTEGGGGRPGDTDGTGVSLLDCWAFLYFARLSGLVPLVGINAGYCFAGNASMLGMLRRR